MTISVRPVILIADGRVDRYERYDMVNHNRVFTEPGDGTAHWVVFEGQLQSPTFNSQEAAQSFLDGLVAGTRAKEPMYK